VVWYAESGQVLGGGVIDRTVSAGRVARAPLPMMAP